MKNSIKLELAAHIVELINDGVLTNENRDEWHYLCFNENYYIIGYYQASQWLKTHGLGEFEAAGICQEYEKENFGESRFFDNAERVVNMLAYIYGEELLNEVDVETVEDLKEELELKTMKEITIKVYSFDELSEEAQERAINKMTEMYAYDQWWDFVYEDAQRIGLKIESFDIDRPNYCNMVYIDSLGDVINKIIDQHGQESETYKVAQNYLVLRDNLVYKYSDKVNTEVVSEDNYFEFDEEENELSDEFIKEIQELYLSILKEEYELLTSEEVIKDIILSNGYEFYEDGTQH